jgi:hypothetical protein
MARQQIDCFIDLFLFQYAGCKHTSFGQFVVYVSKHRSTSAFASLRIRPPSAAVGLRKSEGETRKADDVVRNGAGHSR